MTDEEGKPGFDVLFICEKSEKKVDENLSRKWSTAKTVCMGLWDNHVFQQL